MKNIRFIAICILCTSVSCVKKQVQEEYPILKVKLEEHPVSLFDIFKTAEVIPLETSENSLFAEIDKVECHDGIIYLFCFRLGMLIMFDENGNYINKIHRIGNGPGEYLYAYDFVLNPTDKSVSLLNPFGSVMTYESNGRFISKYDLPHPPPAYRNFELLNNGAYLMWSFSKTKENMGVNIVNPSTGTISHSSFPENDVWSRIRGTSVFHRYNGDIYYHESMAGKVYRFTPDGYRTAYEWDTGRQIINPEVLSDPDYMTDEGVKMLYDMYNDGDIPFIFYRQQQTGKYYFACLRSADATDKYLFHDRCLFYDKESDKSLSFKTTTEGVNLDIITISDDYAIGLIRNNNTEALQKVVSAEDAELLRNRGEEDNWWLVKYTFK